MVVRAISRDIADELRRIEDHVTRMSRLSEDQKVTAQNLYTLLALLWKDGAASYVLTAHDGR